MLSSIRSEALRAVSGLAFLGVIAFGVGIPALLLNTVLSGRVLEGLSPADTSTRVFSLSASLLVVAMFIGSYSVTREYYYSSIGRTLVSVTFRRAFWAKAIAGAICSVCFTGLMCAVWFLVSYWVVIGQGKEFVPSLSMLASSAGTIAAAAIGAIIGNGVGWLVRNYYVACIIVLAVPLALELPLLLKLPDIGRFFPSVALAGLSGVTGLDVLAPLSGAGIAIAWAAVATMFGYVVARKRDT